jgi:flagellar biosynthesis GTPase FlhF
METTIKTVGILTVLDFLAAAYNGMEKNKKIRTFMTLGREKLGAQWLSNRGIKEKFDENHLTFLEEMFFNETHDHCILNMFSEEQVRAFALEIANELIEVKTSRQEAAIYVQIEKNMYEVFEPGTELDNEILKFLSEIPYPEKFEPQTEQQPEAATQTGPETTKATEDTPIPQSDHSMWTPPQEEPVTIEIVHGVGQEEDVLKGIKEKFEPVKQHMPKQTRDLSLPIGDIIDSAVREVMADYELYVNKVVEKALSTVQVTDVVINSSAPIRLKKRVHAAFPEVLEACTNNSQVFLAGPSGTGKTTLCADVAEAMGLPFSFISCTIGMSEAALLGRMDAHGAYIESDFVRIYENGGLYLFD